MTTVSNAGTNWTIYIFAIWGHKHRGKHDKKFCIELRFIYDIKFNHTVTFAGNRNAKFIHTKARQNTKQPTTTVRT